MLAFAAAGAGALAAGAGVYAVGASVAARQLHRHHGHARLGGANAVTLFRLALVSALSIPLFGALLTGAPASGPTPATIAIIAIATVSLSLDGVDGHLARRQGLATAIGGRFDMEVDSVFALVLAALAVVVGGAPWIVLLLGLPRYLFGIAGAIWPWLHGPLPPRYSGKVVAVIQMITLIVLQLPGLPHPLAIVLAVGVLGALGWSFGRDIVSLWRRRE
ncbi:CDP-alcohol phosphatidyltransferase family protein [Microcella frigidaquae]|uniref:Phosphatidylglycerophosphate synthase n=1 Tax=Microcella frigidaquae TaxID=424758 RepID=A0A840XEY0_9MICO|nr:CDP-alcohol phosphatidyltransferase family protein [Microcella frigidaquae]MBB5616896.1 phosphatidylglycerophosphate synthase [Microcella frigidaquae]NHN43665.1 CDP-alcohol phosphatidyltransferase family protein [Microcella frigidaquae]